MDQVPRLQPLLSRQARHLASRFSYGVTPALAADVRAAGGHLEWFEQQLAPDRVRDRAAVAMDDWWPSLSRPASELWQRQITEVEGGWEVMADYARRCLLRRIRSRRQVLEVMTEFWENHFNVPAEGDAPFTWRAHFGDQLRARALGSFEDLLETAILHPAMLIYLDNAVSRADGGRIPNENLGRELLELHTVGRRSGYTEDHVKDSARILTGWSVDLWRSWEPSYLQDWHATGPVRVLGFSHANGSPDGREMTRAYLRYLARHPDTAYHVAWKLCVKFVRDDPPESLVRHLAEVYLAHRTSIPPVLRALVRSAAFKSSVGAKLRDPGEDVAATYRLLGARVERPQSEQSAANAILWQTASLGTRPFAWPRPDGQPLDNDSWSSPSRMLSSMQVHYTMAGGWWPTQDVRYRPEKAWAPGFPVRFDRLVAHMSRQILHRDPGPALLAACRVAVDCADSERITRDHPVMTWRHPRLLTVFLDSPDFYLR
jgi:uncharacterized protein (DUF1800 family)